MQHCLFIFYQDIITKMLHVDPHQRLTAPQVSHQFITFYAQLKIQVPAVPFTANASLEVFTRKKQNVWELIKKRQTVGNILWKYWAYFEVVLCRLFLVAQSRFQQRLRRIFFFVDDVL